MTDTACTPTSACTARDVLRERSATSRMLRTTPLRMFVDLSSTLLEARLVDRRWKTMQSSTI